MPPACVCWSGRWDWGPYWAVLSGHNLPEGCFPTETGEGGLGFSTGQCIDLALPGRWVPRSTSCLCIFKRWN
jgi:hypothetical protein